MVSLLPVHGDVFSDDESHQVFADNERTVVCDARSVDEIVHTGPKTMCE